MSTETPPRGHRHSRSAAMPPASASSQNPQNPHFLNQQSHTRISQSGTKVNRPGSTSQSTTPPRTPRRDNQPPSQNLTNTNTAESGSKQKSRNKNRPKNVMTSPAVTRYGRNTPPLTGAQSAGIPSSAKPINTPSTTAYAGPTFHASPAPSALPIPSFYSKSVPDSPGAKGLKFVKEQNVKETSSPNSLFTPPPANTQANPFQREESPLDFFFRADREEKARARSASSTQTAVAASGPFQPPVESPRSSQTPPALSTHNRPRQGHASRMSANGMFAMELDGETVPETPYGPSFSTPYAERINAARASSQAMQYINPPSHDPQQSLERSEALKAYLFSGHPLPSSDGTSPSGDAVASPLNSTSPSPHQHPPVYATGSRSTGLPTQSRCNSHSLTQDQKISIYVPRPSGRSSGLRQEVTPTKTPTRTPDRNNPYSNSPSRLYENTSSSATKNFNGTMASHTPSPSPTSAISMSSENKASDFQGMEDSLRKILKLDSARSSGVTGGSPSAASASVPNYVGGRPPPMNGMHNGVMGS